TPNRKVAVQLKGVRTGLHDFGRLKRNQRIVVDVEEVRAFELAILQAASGIHAGSLNLDVKDCSRHIRGRESQAGGPLVESTFDRHGRFHGELNRALDRCNLKNWNLLRPAQRWEYGRRQ